MDEVDVWKLWGVHRLVLYVVILHDGARPMRTDWAT